MKLIVQSDDYGMSYGVTDGICLAARKGLLTCTGLMTNFESSEYAANRMKEFPHVLLGQDINLFGGKPVTDPKLIPDLVDENGWFVSSVKRAEQLKSWHNVQGLVAQEDPFPLDQTLLEVENQVNRFIELTGKLPGYIQGHSYQTPNIVEAINTMAKKHNLPVSSQLWSECGIDLMKMTWLKKPVFEFKDQVHCDVENGILDLLDEYVASGKEYGLIICHAGYLDAELFNYSGYTAIRYNDLKMLMSPRLKERLESLNVELINYQDIVGKL
jgi:Uncharacterized protein conserved in bacteria